MNSRQIETRLNLYQKGTLAAFEAFNRDCVHILGGDDKHGHTSIIPFKWWPAQRDLVVGLCDPDLTEIIIDKPRQMGATLTIAEWMLFRAMFCYDNEYRITSVGEDEASKALRKVHFMWENLPDWCKPTLEVDNTTTIKIAATRSWITAIPSTKNAGRGDTLNALLCDEAAYQTYAKEIITSARPSLEKRHGKLLVVSTMEPGTYFAEKFVEATQGKNGYKSYFFDCWADPNRNQKWYDKQLKEHGQEYMSLAYPRTWQESLLAKGVQFFDHLQLAVDIERESDKYEDGLIDEGQFVPKYRGAVRLWAAPIPGHVYVIFADTAEGLPHGDYDNAYVVDVQWNIEVCRIRGKMDPGEYGDILMEAGEWYGTGEGVERTPALLVIEANNHGIAVTKHCLDNGYRNPYYERDLRTGELKGNGRIGWMTNPGKGGTRAMMLGQFQKDYRTGKAKVRDRELLDEMSVFAKLGPAGKAQAPPGKNDDCLPPGTMIRTSKGYIPVENIKAGDMVLTHQGRFREVEIALEKQFSGKMYDMKFIGNVSLPVTYNHPVLAAKQVDHGRSGKAWDSREWVLPENWKKQRGVFKISNECRYELDAYLTDKDFSLPLSENAKVTKIKITLMFARFLGRFLADGCCHKNYHNGYTMSLAFNVNEEEIHEYRKHIKSLGIACRIERKGTGCNALVFSSRLLWTALNCCYDHDREKILPWWAASKIGPILGSVLSGWLEGDSFTHKRGHKIGCTTSKALALGMRDIAFEECRGRATIQEIKRHRYGKPCKNQFWVSVYKTPPWVRDNSKCRQAENGDLIFPLARRTEREYTGAVYNLQVEEDRSFVANGLIVHNCVMSRAGAHIVASFMLAPDAPKEPETATGARLAAVKDLERLRSGDKAQNNGVVELGG